MEMKECSESASQQGSRHAAASALEKDIRSPTSRAKRKRFAREIKEGDITLLDIQGLRTTEKKTARHHRNSTRLERRSQLRRHKAARGHHGR